LCTHIWDNVGAKRQTEQIIAELQAQCASNAIVENTSLKQDISFFEEIDVWHFALKPRRESPHYIIFVRISSSIDTFKYNAIYKSPEISSAYKALPAKVKVNKFWIVLDRNWKSFFEALSFT